MWVSKLPVHNVDAMKHRPKLSYFLKWRFYFPESIMSLDPFHSNKYVSLLWASALVTRDPDAASVSEAEEGA